MKIYCFIGNYLEKEGFADDMTVALKYTKSLKNALENVNKLCIQVGSKGKKAKLNEFAQSI